MIQKKHISNIRSITAFRQKQKYHGICPNLCIMENYVLFVTLFNNWACRMHVAYMLTNHDRTVSIAIYLSIINQHLYKCVRSSTFYM